MIRQAAITGLAALSIAAAPLAMAGHDYDDGYDYAPVIEVEPIVRYVTVEVPHQECWEEIVYHDEHRSRRTPVATFAGGIIGGIIGNQFGSGRGNHLATVAGVLIGSSVAHASAVQRRYAPHAESVRRCRVTKHVRREERIDGYFVTYEYLGREYTTRTDTHPGRRIAVQVSVTPLES